jgi:hypothetical protein
MKFTRVNSMHKAWPYVSAMYQSVISSKERTIALALIEAGINRSS